MVTVLTTNHLKFKINQRDHNPPHVHVEGLGATIRVNLLTLEIMDSVTGFSKPTVKLIIGHVEKHQTALLKQWEENHGKD